MADADVNHRQLRLALERAQKTSAEIANSLKTSVANVEAWLDGQKKPSFRQAEKFAKATGVPFGYLYLTKDLEEDVALPEFRRLPDASMRIDRNVRDLLLDIDFKRNWYLSYRKDQEYGPLRYVGKFEVSTNARTIASDIRTHLNLAQSMGSKRPTFEEYFRLLFDSAERIGIWCMKSGIVRNNTHRSISVNVMRGFAISDPLLPIVFVNGSDAPAAQLFTFVHELAHIWIGSNDVNSVSLEKSDMGATDAAERACNAIAGEFLVPADELAEHWNRSADPEDNIRAIASYFSVSGLVAARRALDSQMIDGDYYQRFFAAEIAAWRKKRERTKGGDFLATIPYRNGRRFTQSVVAEALSGRILLRDAGELLGVKPNKLTELRAATP